MHQATFALVLNGWEITVGVLTYTIIKCYYNDLIGDIHIACFNESGRITVAHFVTVRISASMDPYKNRRAFRNVPIIFREIEGLLRYDNIEEQTIFRCSLIRQGRFCSLSIGVE